MKIEHTEVVWLEARSNYTFDELASMSGLPHPVLKMLDECGVLPSPRDRSPRVFEAESISLARAARRLQDAFELDAEGLAVAVALLRRVRALESELAAMRVRTTRAGDELDR